MSADNWAVCPRCKWKAERAREIKLLEAGAAYGRVPSEQYLKMLAEAQVPVKHDYTFSEDYQMGVREDGQFELEYRGRCDACDLDYSYTFTHSVFNPDAQKESQ